MPLKHILKVGYRNKAPANSRSPFSYQKSKSNPSNAFHVKYDLNTQCAERPHHGGKSNASSTFQPTYLATSNPHTFTDLFLSEVLGKSGLFKCFSNFVGFNVGLNLSVKLVTFRCAHLTNMTVEHFCMCSQFHCHNLFVF